jgi:uncharacterized protein
MRPEWYRLEAGQAEAAWRDQQADFLSRVVGPHFESLCRSFARQAGSGLFGAPVGEVGSGIVNDPANRSQIEIDVAVLASPEPGRPRRLLSLGEVKWGQVMTAQHTARLARARDLLAGSFDVSDCALACYSAAGFSADLRSAAGPGLILVSSGDLYQ